MGEEVLYIRTQHVRHSHIPQAHQVLNSIINAQTRPVAIGAGSHHLIDTMPQGIHYSPLHDAIPHGWYIQGPELAALLLRQTNPSQTGGPETALPQLRGKPFKKILEHPSDLLGLAPQLTITGIAGKNKTPSRPQSLHRCDTHKKWIRLRARGEALGGARSAKICERDPQITTGNPITRTHRLPSQADRIIGAHTTHSGPPRSRHDTPFQEQQRSRTGTSQKGGQSLRASNEPRARPNSKIFHNFPKKYSENIERPPLIGCISRFSGRDTRRPH